MMSQEEASKQCQWNIGLIDPRIIKAFNEFYRDNFTIPFLEHGLPHPPRKRDVLAELIRAGAKFGHFINRWWFDEGGLDMFAAWYKAREDVSAEELREYLGTQLRIRFDDFIDKGVLPLLEKKMGEI